MSDILDEAQDIETAEREAAIARARISQRDPSEEFCMRCGVEIPEARRVAVPGCKHCVDCRQELEEQRT